MKKTMWIVAYALLLMAVPFVQSCSEEDSNPKEFVIPTSPDEILTYIQGKWILPNTEGPVESYLIISKDTLIEIAIENKSQETIYESRKMLRTRDDKLTFSTIQRQEGDFPSDLLAVITIPKEGVMQITNQYHSIELTKGNFDLQPYSLSGWESALEGRWRCETTIEGFKNIFIDCSQHKLFLVGLEEGHDQPTIIDDLKMLEATHDVLMLDGAKYKFLIKRTGWGSFIANDHNNVKYVFKYLEPILMT